jgi:hypothetical protein
MGSNPTPRASNGGSNSSNINNFCKDPIINQDKVRRKKKMTLHQEKIIIQQPSYSNRIRKKDKFYYKIVI